MHSRRLESVNGRVSRDIWNYFEFHAGLKESEEPTPLSLMSSPASQADPMRRHGGVMIFSSFAPAIKCLQSGAGLLK
jgi:hypothetical protein